MAQSISGIVINELIPDTTGLTSFDTDNDGTFNSTDEFVELLNTTGAPVDISGWTIDIRNSDTSGAGDSSRGTFTFPGALNSGTTVIPAGGFAVAIADFTGGPPANFFQPISTLANAGGEITLTNNAGTTIAASYGSDTGSAVPFDDFGDDTDGESLQRAPAPANIDDIGSFVPTPNAVNECFLTGTRILTANGYKPIEELEIGEKVQTAEGSLEEIKWIGYQTINPEQIANPLRGNPIQIKAGALGDNLPLRDLYVSPDHSMFVDGLLINAGALVNDISIVTTEPTETFVYHHVELENHCLLVAEGSAAESYLPNKENRDEYDNAAEYEELYPHGSNLMLWPMDYPRISSWNKVPRFVSKKLLAIAHQLMGQDNKIRA